MFKTFGFGAGQYEMYGRFVPRCVAVSKGFYSGAGLSFEDRMTISAARLPLGWEGKSYSIGSCGTFLGEALDRLSCCSFYREMFG